MDLRNAIQTRSMGENTVPAILNAFVPAIISRYNSEIGPRIISRLPSEELPTSPRAASSFRSRVSLLVEYSVIELVSEFLEETDGLNVTFNTTNEFADFYMRDDEWRVTLRVDVKTLHDLSAEASARYENLSSEISPLDDYLFFLVWQWQNVVHAGVTVTFPALLDGLFIPAAEIAAERDLRQALSGGSFDPVTGKALAASGNPDSNYGKMNRIVHDTRRLSNDLTPGVKRFLELMEFQARARAEEPAALAEVESLADAAATGEVTDDTEAL